MPRDLAPAACLGCAPLLTHSSTPRDAEEWWTFDHSSASSEDHFGARLDCAGGARLRKPRAEKSAGVGKTSKRNYQAIER